MPFTIPQSTTFRVPLYAVLSSDHVSPGTGITIAVTISKNGAAFGNPSAGATNATAIGSGWYYVDLSTTDTGTLGPLIALGTGTGIDNVTIAYDVVLATNGGWTNLDAAVSSRLATGGVVGSVTGAVGSVTAGVTVATNGDKTGYSLSSPQAINITGNITGNLSGSVGSVTSPVTVGTNSDKIGYSLTTGERTSIADALLDRDMSVGTDSGTGLVRTVRQALRFMRNKWTIAGGTLVVCKEDDATTSWSSSIVTTAGNPVSGSTPI
jgi:hypothetical protein